MHYFLAAVGLLGLGFIGLLIETHKQDKQYITNLETENEGLIAEQKQLHDDIKFLQANQKPVPWNKGKKYKLPRGIDGKPLRKETTYVLSDASVVAAWDKDGNQTVAPKWEPIG